MHHQSSHLPTFNHACNSGQWGLPDPHNHVQDKPGHDGMRSANGHVRNDIDKPVRWSPGVRVNPYPFEDAGMARATHGADTDANDSPSSTEYRKASLRMAFAGSGGLLTVGELADGDDPENQARFAQIAKGIATREIIGFMWQGEPWVPMFQFEAGSGLVPRQALQPLFKLLIPLYDAWEMTNWFARPNPWLTNLRPVDECVAHLQSVLDVAHLEYFVATGHAQPKFPAAGRGAHG